jgi:hypothetical protein
MALTTDSMPCELAFKAIVDEAVRDLVAADHRKGSSFVRTPLLYPGGSSVVVRVDDCGTSFLVTDMALGYQEADLMGAALIYSRHAGSIAENSGIRFDSESFLIEVDGVDGQQLSGAIAAIANCSYEAVALAAYKLSERRAGDVMGELYQGLVRILTGLARVSATARDSLSSTDAVTRWVSPR